MSIVDYHMQHVLHRILDGEGPDTKHQLRNIRACGRKLIPPGTGTLPLVAVLRSDDGKANLFGHAHCRNPFCCPVCEAKIMEVYRAKIASALDMQEHSGEWGFMATFTIPHLKFMSCRETTDILYDTWRYFRQRLKSSHKNSTWEHPYRQFTEATGVSSWVRVCEYTYGEKNGWHPHFHCIFWVPKEHFDDVLAWEEKLCNFWIEQAKRVTLQYWRKNDLHAGEDLDKLLLNVFKRANWWGQALRFSRDGNGKLLKATSANYVAGWTTDQEVTGNCKKKASHEGHYTPYQILEMAEHDKHWARTYIDFCLNVTRKPVHHRLNFSKNGICKRIAEWNKTHVVESTSHIKKNTWAPVTFFYADDWYTICELNKHTPVIANILYLAQNADHEELLFDYIESLGVPPKRRRLTPQFDTTWAICDLITDIFNSKNFRRAESA